MQNNIFTTVIVKDIINTYLKHLDIYIIYCALVFKNAPAAIAMLIALCLITSVYVYILPKSIKDEFV